MTILFASSFNFLLLQFNDAVKSNRSYLAIYQVLVIFFMFVIPFACIVIFNSLIFRQIRKMNQIRQQLSRNEKRDVRLTKMLFFIVCLYLCCNIIEATMRICYLCFGLIIIDCRVYHTSDLLLTINSSMNFIIYVMIGKKFQEVFLSMFYKRRHIDLNSSVESQSQGQTSQS